jgi:hypothetical protein
VDLALDVSVMRGALEYQRAQIALSKDPLSAMVQLISER